VTPADVSTARQINFLIFAVCLIKKMGRVLPGGVVAWFVLSFPVCLWDALFVLLRPRTMPGGDLAWFWGPCTSIPIPIPIHEDFWPFSHFICSPMLVRRLDETYIAVDRRYQDLNDGFNIAQAWYETIINNIIYNLFFISCLGAATKLKRATRTSFFRSLSTTPPG
jgi:hypothetical protein